MEFMEIRARASLCVCRCLCLYSSADRNMIVMSVPTSHWGLLLLCIAAFCSQLVATGNQSSGGPSGRCQTHPDQLNPLRGSLWLLVTSPGAGMTVATL